VGIQYADFSTDAVSARHRLEALFGRTASLTTDEGRPSDAGTDWSARKDHLPRDLDLDAALDELAAMGKYEVVDYLATTVTGRTLLARQTRLKYEVILKSYRLPPSDDADQRSALVREIQHRARLRHPVLVTPIEVVPTENALFVVTQHVADARSLRDLLYEEVGRQGPMTSETACKLLRQVTLGLAHAHAMGISHQSLDPWDILVNADNRVWVAGFERAAIYEHYRKVSIGKVYIPPTSLRYSSPEMGYGKPLDSATDVYHVGIILCELLTGVAPVETRVENFRPSMFDIGSIRPKVARIKDPRLRELCLRCLQPRKEDRFSNAGDLFTAFLSLQEKKPWWQLWT
jgi:serine/threonine-protein kinase